MSTYKKGRGILTNGLSDFVRFWNEIYQAYNVLEELHHRENFVDLPKNTFEKFQMAYYPEPYYGYLHEDISDDVLLLLLNPGHVNESYLDMGRISEMNQRVRERYTLPWNKMEYMQEEERLKKTETWRSVRFKQVENIIGPFGFLHTIEFFPFHSKHYPSQLTKPWVYDLQSTKLSFRAVKEIATERRVKQILSIGQNWEVILRQNKVPVMAEVKLIKHGGKRFSFKFVIFQFSPCSLPITVFTLGSGAMSLPTDPFAVQVVQSLIGLRTKEIPGVHDTYKVIVGKDEH